MPSNYSFYLNTAWQYGLSLITSSYLSRVFEPSVNALVAYVASHMAFARVLVASGSTSRVARR